MATTGSKKKRRGRQVGTRHPWYTPEERASLFWSRVERCTHGACTACCWPWTGARQGASAKDSSHIGRGIAHWHGEVTRAAVVAWLLWYGHRPVHCVHRCQTPACVNPFHHVDQHLQGPLHYRWGKGKRTPRTYIRRGSAYRKEQADA